MSEPTVSPERLEALGLDTAAAEQLAAHVNEGAPQAEPAERWRRLCRSVLTPRVPFAVHQHVHDIVFASWNDAAGPRAVWVPSKEDVEYANLTHLGRRIGDRRVQ